MTDDKKKDMVVFLDLIGRTIIAKRIEETDSKLKIENPAVVNIISQPVNDPITGQVVQRMALQLFPLFFREFLAAKDEPVRFTYYKNNITMADDMALEFKVGIQYDQLFSSVGSLKLESPKQVAVNATNQPEVIKLFDE